MSDAKSFKQGFTHTCTRPKSEGKFIFKQGYDWDFPYIELNNALKHGYTIEKIYDVLHWEKTSKDLFKGYIGLFTN
jgi:hypothetical protein